MKNSIHLLGTIIIGLSCSLWLSGCGGDGDHAGHDHDHEHGDEHQHEEGTGDAKSGVENQMAGAISEVADSAANAATKLAEDVTEMSEEAMIAAQSATYPLTKCVVSGEDLGSMGDAINYIHEGTLIKLCCDHCKPDVEKDPAKFAAMVKAAAAK